jgi:TPP-dependent pyruvate/acetoin dehydrogenase alpha subunit
MEEEKSSRYRTISSDIEEDTPPDPIKELKEILLNMQWAHAKQFEAMNEQLTISLMEARLAEMNLY